MINLYILNSNKDKVVEIRSIKCEIDYDDDILKGASELYYTTNFNKKNNKDALYARDNYLNHQVKIFKLYINNELFETYEDITNGQIKFRQIVNAIKEHQCIIEL